MKDTVGAFLMSWRIRVVFGVLKGDVLDVGCGTNELVNTYKTIHPEYKAVGVDVYPWEGVDAVILNSTNLPFADASFDTICCIAALNHIPEREGFLREAKRILRPHGHLVLTMLPPGISRVWHFLRFPWDVDQHERGIKEGELYGLSTNSIKTLLETAGFSLTRVSSFMLWINKLYVAENI